MFKMRGKSMIALGVSALAATILAAGAGGAQAAQKTLVVWLMPDAQNFGTAVADANKAFQAAYPNWKVDVQYQTWGDHLKKFDAALAAKQTPDVLEFGNTEVMKYSSAGALADLTSYTHKFYNSAQWLTGLTQAGSYAGHLYAVPYYAGARAILYRPSMFAAQGIKIPKSYAQFLAAGKKLMAAYGSDPKFSALYLPGKYWYAAMSFVYDAGGSIAVQQNGKWAGNLSSAESIAGLNRFKTVSNTLSRADTNGTEANQWTVFDGGKVAMAYSNGWESCCIPSIGSDWGFFQMPSVTTGKASPSFLGGSNLAVPIYSTNVNLGATWIRYYTNTTQMTTIANTGAIPNNTRLLHLISGKAAPVALAAKSSWFVPQATHWVDVENANVLQSMLSDIASGKQTVAAAAAAADTQITSILNQS